MITYIKYEVIVYQNGTKDWYLNGKRHREDGPAIEWPDGTKHWYLNGKHHREDGPAIEYSDGAKEWWLNGNRHREDGPAIVGSDGTKEWYLNDKWLSKGGHKKAMSSSLVGCEGKVVEIDGKKYKLTEITKE